MYEDDELEVCPYCEHEFEHDMATVWFYPTTLENGSVGAVMCPHCLEYLGEMFGYEEED